MINVTQEQNESCVKAGTQTAEDFWDNLVTGGSPGMVHHKIIDQPLEIQKEEGRKNKNLKSL